MGNLISTKLIPTEVKIGYVFIGCDEVEENFILTIRYSHILECEFS